jgi:Gluconate 2-dehydrogenase subunit 3
VRGFVKPVLSRRELLRAGGGLALLAAAPPDRVARLLAQASAPGRAGHYLRAGELDALRALTDRLVPGPPADPGPGAREARAAEAIDLLLGAFAVHPPLIHAGGPFSDRAGGRSDGFARFQALDRQAALGWRIRLEGSRGRREREFAGPVVGLQEIYRTGLARLDALARRGGARSFAAAPPAAQDALVAGDDKLVARLVDAALVHTLEAVLGPPEYGGNHDLVGWRTLSWQGDAQPRGFSRAQVTRPDRGPARAHAAAPPHLAAALAALAPELGGRRAATARWWARHRGLGGR